VLVFWSLVAGLAGGLPRGSSQEILPARPAVCGEPHPAWAGPLSVKLS
jgi:hypothetical protein